MEEKPITIYLLKTRNNQRFGFLKAVASVAAFSAVKTVAEFPVGAKFAYRAKDDWRVATIARIGKEKATFTVCSPTGRTYRLYRILETEVKFVKNLPTLMSEKEDEWNENLTGYDRRW